MPEMLETSWWLDGSALPERLLWARLVVFRDGAAEVFDRDGNYHPFPNRDGAVFWLLEDEYSHLARLVEGGEVEVDVAPPRADNDRELLPLTLGKRRVGSPS